ncbi:hypothetical protein L1887_14155 [Cichorium endivia]|nr:hypothetical protein L1887_14155 [Cichorium endivia]
MEKSIVGIKETYTLPPRLSSSLIAYRLYLPSSDSFDLSLPDLSLSRRSAKTHANTLEECGSRKISGKDDKTME